MPLDRFGRKIDYLRISLTDHCNLRCVYCMPVKGLQFAPSEELLSAEEIATVVSAAVRVGFRKFRLTGGEPTLRSDLIEIVERIMAVEGVDDLGMTTNGILLPRLADPLRKAGLRRVNVHIDSLDPDHLKRVMRFGTVERIWAGIEAAEAAGLTPIKLNCTVVGEYNDKDVVDLARLTLERDWHVRFIEMMPLGDGECAQVALSRFIPTAETRRRIESVLGPLTELPTREPSQESRNYRLPDARGIVGFISPVSEPFCGNCSRMRLTADGRFHLCLLNDDEMDVKTILRTGNRNGAIEAIIRQAVAAKPTGHRLEEGVSVKNRQMFQIGG